MSKTENVKVNVDEAAVDELVLWFENNENLYNRREAWIANFERKIKRGVFDEEKAIQGVLYLVEETRKSYKQANGLGDINKATKLETARRIFESSIKEDLVTG